MLVENIPDSDDEGEEDEYNYNKSQILLKIVMNYIQLVSVIASFEFKWVKFIIILFLKAKCIGVSFFRLISSS